MFPKKIISFSFCFKRQNNFPFLFLFIFLTKSIFSASIYHELTCDGEKPISNVCAVNKYSPDHKKATVVIKKNCGKDKKCVNDKFVGNEDMYHCIDVTKAKKIGEKCKLDSDCLTNYCNKNKCEGVKEQGNCEFQKCASGYACSELEESESYHKCLPLQNKESDCKTDSIRCIFGTKCSDYGPNPKCKPFGSVAIGGNSAEPLICETGMIYNNTCVSVAKDGKCRYFTENNGTSYFRCEEIIFEGSEYFVDEKPLKCEAYIGVANDETNYVCPLSIIKGKVWNRYMKKFDKKIKGNLEKINKDEKNFYDNPNGFKFKFDDPELISTDIVFYYADQFIVRGYLDEKGEIKKEYKCEVDWLISYLDSKLIKYSFNSLLLIALGIIL